MQRKGAVYRMRRRLLIWICAGLLTVSCFPFPILAESTAEKTGTEAEGEKENTEEDVLPEKTGEVLPDEILGAVRQSLMDTAPEEPEEEKAAGRAVGTEKQEEELTSQGILSRPENYEEEEDFSDGELEEYKEADSTKVDGNEVVKYIYRSLRDAFGFNHAAACAVVANARHESNFNYTVVGDGGTSYGIFQWHAGRWQSLRSWCEKNGYDWQNADGQIAYFRYELENGYHDVLDYLLALEDSDVGAFDGAYYMCVHFEKPADLYGQANSRGKEAIDFFGMEDLRNSYRESIASSNESKDVWDLSNY